MSGCVGVCRTVSNSGLGLSRGCRTGVSRVCVQRVLAVVADRVLVLGSLLRRSPDGLGGEAVAARASDDG